MFKVGPVSEALLRAAATFNHETGSDGLLERADDILAAMPDED